MIIEPRKIGTLRSRRRLASIPGGKVLTHAPTEQRQSGRNRHSFQCWTIQFCERCTQPDLQSIANRLKAEEVVAKNIFFSDYASSKDLTPRITLEVTLRFTIIPPRISIGCAPRRVFLGNFDLNRTKMKHGQKILCP